MEAKKHFIIQHSQITNNLMLSDELFRESESEQGANYYR